MSAGDWQRLDPRMLLVYPVKELVRFLPVLLGLFLAHTATGSGGAAWQLFGVAVPVVLGVLRYVTTSYRIARGRIELRRGLLSRHVLSTPVDRVRTVDISAPLVHRLLGLTAIRIGTGTASSDDDDQLDLDGLPAAAARRLRSDLLLAGRGGLPPGRDPAPPVVELDPSWVRFAPFTSAGLVVAAAVLGAAGQALNSTGGFERLDPERVAADAAAWSPWVAVPLALVGLAVLVTLLSVGGYVVTNWGFRLSHTGSTRGGAWHLRRGLVTTRETTLDDERLRGVSIGEPLALRLAGGARASAIVTGLDRRQSRGSGGSSVLVPPAPRAVVDRVAGAVLHTDEPVTAPLVGHGPRARRRRLTRALAPALVLVVLLVAAVPGAGLPVWVAVVGGLVAVAVALALAADRAAGLGHALVAGYVVVRSGSLDRRREALEVDGVIGWTFRSTWFQRRAGLTTLVATTAGGRQAVTAIDIPEDTAVALAVRAHAELLRPFTTYDAPPA